MQRARRCGPVRASHLNKQCVTQVEAHHRSGWSMTIIHFSLSSPSNADRALSVAWLSPFWAWRISGCKTFLLISLLSTNTHTNIHRHAPQPFPWNKCVTVEICWNDVCAMIFEHFMNVLCAILGTIVDHSIYQKDEFKIGIWLSQRQREDVSDYKLCVCAYICM